MPGYKIYSAPHTFNFGSPLLILSEFTKGHFVVLEMALIVRENNHKVKFYQTHRHYIDTRLDTSDIRNPQRIDVDAERKLFNDNAMRSFMAYGMSLPINLELKPKEPPVNFTEAKDAIFYRILKFGTGRDEFNHLADYIENPELKNVLKNTLAMEITPVEPPEPYNDYPE